MHGTERVKEAEPQDNTDARQIPAFRRDGAYSLMVFLHAQTIKNAGLQDALPNPETLAVTLEEAAEALRGMERYQTHPFQRFTSGVPVVWRMGSVRLLDFGGSGPPILAIPSLVNGAEIMDLSPESSPLRWLTTQGFRVFQIDWGMPGSEELGFDLGGYLKKRLMPALDVVSRLTGENVHLLGYCMGGPVMLALAQRRPDQVSKIVTLGAPWDFSAFPEHLEMRERRLEVIGMLNSLTMLFGVIPSQLTQSFFALRDLSSGVSKFQKFAAMEPNSSEAKRFVAVEDWLNNGTPLSSHVGRECFLDWVTDDTLRKGGWSPGGVTFDPEEVRQQALVVSAQRDTVVRRAASEPLADALDKATLLRSEVGHIGMVVGDAAIKTVWQPVSAFLRG